MVAMESWCLVHIDGQQIRVKIVHAGRGRFRIVEDDGGRYVGRLVDASDVIHCRFGY